MPDASNVLTRIRQACSPPKKNTSFEPLQSAPTSLADLNNLNSATPLVNVTSTTRSIARTKSNHSTKRLSSSKQATEPAIKPESPPRTPPTKSSPTPTQTLSPKGYFELTPLSGLIKQSFSDIALLRRLHEVQTPTYPSPVYTPASDGAPKPKPSASPKPPKGNTSPQVQQAMVDFQKVEDNLKKFEELYRQFLNYGGRFGEGAEEVHLVAVVCKRSDVVKGQIGPGDDTVPRVQRVWVDCGF